jgi:hypothetical protein
MAFCVYIVLLRNEASLFIEQFAEVLLRQNDKDEVLFIAFCVYIVLLRNEASLCIKQFVEILPSLE